MIKVTFNLHEYLQENETFNLQIFIFLFSVGSMVFKNRGNGKPSSKSGFLNVLLFPNCRMDTEILFQFSGETFVLLAEKNTMSKCNK